MCLSGLHTGILGKINFKNEKRENDVMKYSIYLYWILKRSDF